MDIKMSVNMLFYATRYALTRNTGAPLDVCNTIRHSVKDMTIRERTQLAQEIQGALARKEVPNTEIKCWMDAENSLMGNK